MRGSPNRKQRGDQVEKRIARKGSLGSQGRLTRGSHANSVNGKKSLTECKVGYRKGESASLS